MTDRQDDAKQAKPAEYPKKMYREDHYAPATADVKVVNSKTEETALGPGWSDKPKQVKDGDKDVREYPRSMYNKDDEIKVVNSKEEEAALGSGWKDGYDHGQAKLKDADNPPTVASRGGMQLEDQPKKKAS